jgi:hypothetical protein
VTQSAIDAHINKGFAIAANKLGASFALYRPRSAGPILNPINMLDVVNLGFDTDARFGFKGPSIYNKPVVYGLVDRTELQIGDYLTDGGDTTFFIANIEPLRPAMLVRCNRIVSIFQPLSATAIGPQFYGGNVGGTGAPQLTSWPASILIGPKGEQNTAGLPADPRAPWYAVLLPITPNITLRTGDVLIDDLNRRYTMSAVELSVLGWRCTCSYGGT